MASDSATVLSAGTGPAALYQQVKAFVLRGIHDGTLRPGDRVPSEQELVTTLGVARMTVNRALRELADQGRIVRVSGVGSFVAADKPQSTLLQIANIGNEIRQRGHDYQCQLLEAVRRAASPDVGMWLDLAPGASVFHSLCLHHEDGVPVQLEDRYVNPRIVPAYLEQDFTRTPPAEYLVHSVPYDQIEHVVDAVLPTEEQARHLAIAATDPCLLLTRRTWSRGQIVTMVRCLHPGARYRLGSRFRVDGNASAG